MNGARNGTGREPAADRDRLGGGRVEETGGDDGILRQLIHGLLAEPRLQQCGVGRHVGLTLLAERPAAHASWWIEVCVQNGIITLDGNVPSLAHKKLAGDVADQIADCCVVINALKIAPT